MKQWAFNIVAGVSLALCLAVSAAWVSSEREMNEITYSCRPLAVSLANPKGQLVVVVEPQPFSTDGWKRVRHPPIDLDKEFFPPTWRWGPIATWSFAADHFIAVRPWLLVVIFAVLPACWLLRGPLQRRRRKRLGLCLKCGYDLRATPERCPECGTAKASSARKVRHAAGRGQDQVAA